MKKAILNVFALCTVAFCMLSCQKEEMTDSRPTYYPVFSIVGDEFQIVPVGSSFEDQGCKATLNGEDYSSYVVAYGADDVDPNSPGLYEITYVAVNPDGYSSECTRTVAVCDPSITTDISGTYTVQESAARNYGGNISPYKSGLNVKFTEVAPGLYYVSDFFAGWYDQGAGYGSNYAMKGYMQLLADNTLKAISASVAGWGDSYDDFRDGQYDPETGIISWNVDYAGVMTFNVVVK